MTREQTRQLGIEFERRLMELIPQYQFEAKLTTNDIYSYLNQFQRVYVKQLFLLSDSTDHSSKQYANISNVVRSLIRNKRLNHPIKDENRQEYTLFNFPKDYYMYIRSTSIIDKNYKAQDKLSYFVHTPNLVIKEDEVPSVLQSYYNQGGILRNPLIVFEADNINYQYLKVFHDKYTHIDALDLTYYCYPYDFNVLGFDDEDMKEGAIHSYCELPYFCFDDLVDGALKLFIQNYKNVNSYNQQPQRQEQQRQNQRQEDEQ